MPDIHRVYAAYFSWASNISIAALGASAEGSACRMVLAASAEINAAAIMKNVAQRICFQSFITSTA